MPKKILDKIPYKIIKAFYNWQWKFARILQEFERIIYVYYMERLLLNMKQEEQQKILERHNNDRRT